MKVLFQLFSMLSICCRCIVMAVLLIGYLGPAQSFNTRPLLCALLQALLLCVLLCALLCALLVALLRALLCALLRALLLCTLLCAALLHALLSCCCSLALLLAAAKAWKHHRPVGATMLSLPCLDLIMSNVFVLYLALCVTVLCFCLLCIKAFSACFSARRTTRPRGVSSRNPASMLACDLSQRLRKSGCGTIEIFPTMNPVVQRETLALVVQRSSLALAL